MELGTLLAIKWLVGIAMSPDLSRTSDRLRNGESKTRCTARWLRAVMVGPDLTSISATVVIAWDWPLEWIA